MGSNMDKIYIVMNYVEHDLKSLMETMKQPFLPGGAWDTGGQLRGRVSHSRDLLPQASGPSAAQGAGGMSLGRKEPRPPRTTYARLCAHVRVRGLCRGGSVPGITTPEGPGCR